MKTTTKDFVATQHQFIKLCIQNPPAAIVAAINKLVDEKPDILERFTIPVFNGIIRCITDALPDGETRVSMMAASIELRIVVYLMHKIGFTMEEILIVTHPVSLSSEQLVHTAAIITAIAQGVKETGLIELQDLRTLNTPNNPNETDYSKNN